jgi:hypothetical protein
LLKYLKHDCGITDVLRVSLWEASASVTTYVVQKQKAGLPKPSLREPRWGYPLGWWTREDEEEDDLAVQGEYYKMGEKAKQQRKKI